MPAAVGKLIVPRHSAAPSSPVTGTLYYDTDDNTLYWWNGTAWISAQGGSPTGTAGGDLAGTYPNPTIAAGIIVDADINSAAAIEATKINWHIGTTPPGSPATGMLWIYTGSGFYWMFIYDASETTYKWKFIGGGDMIAAVITDEAFTDDGTYKDATTVGPTVTLPRAGDYVLEARTSFYIASHSATARSCNLGLTASSGTWDSNGAGGTSASSRLFFASTGGAADDTSMVDSLRGAAASATVKCQYQMASDTGTPHARQRWLGARPIRVI